jgi:hypothetical protein
MYTASHSIAAWPVLGWAALAATGARKTKHAIQYNRPRPLYLLHKTKRL